MNVSKLIKSDGAQASWSKSKTSLVTSNGFIGQNHKTYNSISVVVIGKKNGKMERDYEFSSKVYFNDLEDSRK